MTDERLATVRDELEAGAVSPQSLVLLFNIASDADIAGDAETLEQALECARSIAATAGEGLREEADRLASICEQHLAGVRERQGAAVVTPPRTGTRTCPDCGNEVPADALRCRRCGHRFIEDD